VRVLALLFCLLALPARAGLFTDDEARDQVAKLRADFEALAQRVDGAAKSQLDFANQMESMRADVSRLRGQLEVMSNSLDAAQKRQQDFYIDLDTRLRKLETAAAPPPAETKPEAKVDPAAETKDYEAALTAFKGAKYKDALAGLQSFIKTYPSSGLLPNAYFWAASSHFQLHDYAHSAEAFAKVAATWPNDPKAPDALLGQANAQAEAGDVKGAKKTLAQLVSQYPTSTAARAAKQRLKK
jgi:tol-pal system protein YbgF